MEKDVQVRGTQFLTQLPLLQEYPEAHPPQQEDVAIQDPLQSFMPFSAQVLFLQE